MKYAKANDVLPDEIIELIHFIWKKYKKNNLSAKKLLIIIAESFNSLNISYNHYILIL